MSEHSNDPNSATESVPEDASPHDESGEPSNLAFGLLALALLVICLLYTSPSPRDQRGSRMPSSA